ncbi:hypothetical protein Btru_035421 [Bulinus truncatus]|nr:hypothetical protein Btru_035421 [Bulinus truncatus]
MNMSDVAETSTTDQGLTLSTPLSSPPIVSYCKSPTSSTSSALTSHVAATLSSSGSHIVSRSRFPVRVGISWVKGEKLEAMDFSRTWYPSKIVDIDEDQKVVLIHFEGWNQRYDEWVPMDSDKLRPVTRHSERKDRGPKKRRIHPHPIYRAGEQVLAKWTDCKKYPAKINRMMEDGSYEVNFYDGVSCQIQAMNIQPLPEEMKNMKSMHLKSPPSLKPKVSFKNIKVSLPDCVKKKVEQHAAEKKKTELQIAEVSKKKDEHQLSGIIKKKLEPPMTESMGKKVEQKPQEIMKKKVEQSSSLENLKTEQETPQTWQKVEQVTEETMQTTEGNTSSTNRKLSPKVFIKREPDKDSFSCHLRRSPLKSLKKEPLKPSPGLLKSDNKTIDFKSEKVLESEAEPVKSKTTTTIELNEALTSVTQDVAQNPQDTEKSNDYSEKTLNCELKTQPVDDKDAILDNTSQQVLKISKCQRRPGRRRSKKRCFSQMKVGSKKMGLKSPHDVSSVPNIKIKSPLHKSVCVQSFDTSIKNDPATDIPAIVPFPPPQKYIPSKAFIVEEDHNPFKCHFEGCTKAFRKESLLTSHIKYYHTNVDTPTSSTATTAIAYALGSSAVQSALSAPGSRKRRKKTSSICSTDSDVSIGSKEKLLLSKRYRHDSEISVTAGSPDLLSKDIWADINQHRCSQDAVHGDMVETEEEEFEKDVVNCVCGQRETNGLMIQCDICMCWQHFACMDTNNSGEPPANYVCYVCENTPGVRDSCKYLYDLSWEKKGDLPTFPFVNEAPTENLKSLAIECHEISSTLHKLKAALHSTRRQIKISKEEEDHEFQLWQTDWDNWTKPDEDLTLTPRSVDPDPSPTPSTFLFPSAPSTSLNNVSSSATISSSTPTYSGPSPVSATIEVASGLPPSPSNTPLSCGLDRSIKTRETPSSENLSTSHKGYRLSVEGKADILVRDIFHGPGGDADNFSKLTYKTSVSDSSKIESTGVTHHEDTLINGDSLSTKPNISVGAKEALQSSSSVSSSLSLAQDESKTDLPVEKPSQCALQMESSSTARSDQAEYPSAEQSHKAPFTGQKQMDRDDVIDGHSSKQMSELYVDVSGVQSHSTVYTDDQDNDTDTAEESVDPYKNCEHNLLVHVTKVHASVEKHLELIEQQIAELENSVHSNSTAQIPEENILNDIPALKKSLGKLLASRAVASYCGAPLQITFLAPLLSSVRCAASQPAVPCLRYWWPDIQIGFG